MMNPIGIRNEDQIGTRDPWFAAHTTATSVLEHGGAVPGGTRVRRSGWPGWRSATGRSCGRRARAGSGWPSPSATTGTTPDATHAAPGSTSDPSSAPPPGRAPPGSGRGLARPAPNGPSPQGGWAEPLGGERASTPAVVRALAGHGVGAARPTSRQGRPPLMIWCCEDQTSDSGRRPQRRRRPRLLAGAVRRAAGPGRRSVRSGGSSAASQGVRARPAFGPAKKELLDDRRARR